MFILPASEPVKPSGELVHTAVTAGNTMRHRGGLTVEVYRNAIFRLFIDGAFVAGWNDLPAAIAYAARF